MLNDTAVRFLEARGIDVELASRLGLESCMSGGGEAIKIPFVVGDQAVNHKYRRLDDKLFSQDKGATKCFWNFNALVDATLQSEPLVITEGEFDAMAALQSGIARVVSVPDGAPGREIKLDEDTKAYRYLDHARAPLKEADEVVLATDGDEPGIALMNDLALRIGRPRCKWVIYPRRKDGDGRCKDLNEVLQAYGPRGVQEVIKRAQWCRIDGVYRMSELRPVPERQRHSTGFPFLDRHVMIRPGDFSVITGIPGHGKSTFVNDLVCRLVERHGWTIALASFEQHPQTDHRKALRTWYCGKRPKYCDAVELADADAWIDRHFVFIVPSDEDLASLEWTLDKVASAVVRYGAKMAVIDPWNELDHDWPPGRTETQYTGDAIKQFKLLASKLDCHVCVVAHPKKLGREEVPGLYDISGSAHWANKPDLGMVISRDPETGIATLDVVKSRYWDEIGTPGTVHMSLDRQRMRFTEAVAPEELSQ